VWSCSRSQGHPSVGVAQATHHLDEPQDLRAGGLLGEEDQLDLQVVFGGHARERRREAVVLRTEQVDDPALPAGVLDQRLGDPAVIGGPGTTQVQVAPLERGRLDRLQVEAGEVEVGRSGVRGGVADKDPLGRAEDVPGLEGQQPREQLGGLHQGDAR
jgi:hypothetical protein